MNSLENYLYQWPTSELSEKAGWKESKQKNFNEFIMPESEKDLAEDSKWPGFFPSSICFVTTSDGKVDVLEKVVGANIVNRFPYTIALSFCSKSLSKRHYSREKFMSALEKGNSASINFFEPGKELDLCMEAISEIPDQKSETRIEYTNLKTRNAITNNSKVFEDAYLVYEAKLVKPGLDFEGHSIFDEPFIDHGSHRIYFLEIQTIQLRKDIAQVNSQIHWRALPQWSPKLEFNKEHVISKSNKFIKGYTDNYYFPSLNTIGFEYDKLIQNMAVKFLEPLPKEQMTIDNDKARWPCFFPSSLGMISTYGMDGTPNIMPCGSTTVLVRSPLTFGICISYARINERYAPRESIKSLLEKKKFNCGVAYSDELMIEAIKYSGNVSALNDKNKIENSGLSHLENEFGPLINEFPINFCCSIVKIVRLGTHFLLLGEVEKIYVRKDVSLENPLKWNSYSEVVKIK